MSIQPPMSPDSRKRKPALPFLLSNLRNAQATIASSVAGTTEIRPLVTSSSSSNNDHNGSSYASDRSNMKRSVTASLSSSTARAPYTLEQSTPNTRLNTNTSSISSTLTSLSQRFENTWRKRNQHLHKEDSSVRTRRRRQIRVSIPQSFLFSSVCFFIGIPLLVLLYVLARKSAFGDEGVEISEHKYEVKSFDEPATKVGVLSELEGQLKDVVEEDAANDILNLDGNESDAVFVVDNHHITGEDNNDTTEGMHPQEEDMSQDGTQNNEPGETNVSEQNDGNLRGYQPSDIQDNIAEPNNDASDSNVDLPEQSLDVKSENSNAEVHGEILGSDEAT